MTNPLNDQTFESIDAELNVIDHGEGHPILLVHGFPLDHTLWQHQIAQLASDYRVVAVDLPGFGGSQPIGSDVSLTDYANALAAILDSLNIDRPVTFCGLSMGGYIGWQFLKRHRERVANLIACDTRAAADDERTARGRRVMASQVVVNGATSIADGLTAKICGSTTLERRPEVVEHVKAMICDTDAHSIAAGQLAMAARPDATSWLAEIDVPTLVVVGQEDAITPPAEMKAMADQITGSQFVEIPYAGHLAPLENPVAFNAAIRAFLESAV